MLTIHLGLFDFARREPATSMTVYETVDSYGEHHATQKGIFSQDHQLKYQNRVEGGQATKTGCGDRFKQSRKKEQAEQARQAIEFSLRAEVACRTQRLRRSRLALLHGEKWARNIWSLGSEFPCVFGAVKQAANSRLQPQGTMKPWDM